MRVCVYVLAGATVTSPFCAYIIMVKGGYSSRDCSTQLHQEAGSGCDDVLREK